LYITLENEGKSKEFFSPYNTLFRALEDLHSKDANVFFMTEEHSDFYNSTHKFPVNGTRYGCKVINVRHN